MFCLLLRLLRQPEGNKHVCSCYGLLACALPTVESTSTEDSVNSKAIGAVNRMTSNTVDIYVL